MNTQTTFCCAESDCQWLREGHLATKNLDAGTKLPEFKSFMLIGNEDCPDGIHLYEKKLAMISHVPAMFTLNEDGTYRQSFPIPTPAISGNLVEVL